MYERFIDNVKFLKYGIELTGKYKMPVIKKQDIQLSEKTVSFNNRNQKEGVALHFFIDDYQFDRIWNNPERYIDMFREYEYICSPDYSLYSDFPLILQMFNSYKKQYLGALFQKYGIKVVPTVSWSDESSYEWCFDGIEQGSCVACSSVGCMNNGESKRLFVQGFLEMINRINPKKILMNGKLPEELKEYKELCVFIKTHQEEIRERVNSNA